MKILYPGTFNPWTIGHQYVLSFLIDLFGKDNVVVGIARNLKKTNVDYQKIIRHLAPIHPHLVFIDELVADFCNKQNIDYVARGLRSVTDFEEELNLADWNYSLGTIKTIFVPCQPELQKISSSSVRQLHEFGRPVDDYFPHEISQMRWLDITDRSNHTIYFGKTCVGKSYLLQDNDYVDFDKEIWYGLSSEEISEYKSMFSNAIKNRDMILYENAQNMLIDTQYDNIFKLLEKELEKSKSIIEISALGVWYELLPKDLISKFTLIKIGCSDEVRKERIGKRNKSLKVVKNFDFFYKDPPYWDIEKDTTVL